VTGAGAEVVAVALLAVTLAVAVVRPFGASEGVVAVPAALLVVGLHIVPRDAATRELREIGPTVAFLAAILVFGHLCARAGVFDHLGSVAAQLGAGRPQRLFAIVVAMAAAVTVVLTLDATVVLFTPVVVASVGRLRLPSRAFAYACVRLANSGSLLLPVSNLTNLLAFSASGLSFTRFAALMTLPWLAVCLGEWAGLRQFFAADFDSSIRAPGTLTSACRTSDSREPDAPPRYALAVLTATVAGFVGTSFAHISPAWAALGGCLLLLAAPSGRRSSPRELLSAASVGFCAFVLALAILVDGVTRHGLHRLLIHLVPHADTLPALVTAALVGALLANVVNNLPATLALVPLVAGSPALVLAVLLGVNIGPNAAYPGSLATLLWRRTLPREMRPRGGEFHLLGALTVPGLLVVSSAALWLSLRAIGT
jgi:arsenical pump membrane protein